MTVTRGKKVCIWSFPGLHHVLAQRCTLRWKRGGFLNGNSYADFRFVRCFKWKTHTTVISRGLRVFVAKEIYGSCATKIQIKENSENEETIFQGWGRIGYSHSHDKNICNSLKFSEKIDSEEKTRWSFPNFSHQEILTSANSPSCWSSPGSLSLFGSVWAWASDHRFGWCDGRCFVGEIFCHNLRDFMLRCWGIWCHHGLLGHRDGLGHSEHRIQVPVSKLLTRPSCTVQISTTLDTFCLFETYPPR